MPSRPQVAPTEDWRQIELLARAPGQRTYELIRPVVLFGQSPAERAAETGAAERTLYRQVARFDQLGMASFVPPPKIEKHRTLPPEVCQAILDARREHPPLNVHEITTICWARRGQRPNSHTVKRILTESPPPPRTHRRFPPCHAIADPTQRRLAIVRLHVQGWNATTIAAYLETSRQTVQTTLKRWAEEEFAGMPDKSRAPQRPRLKSRCGK
jgi:transposase